MNRLLPVGAALLVSFAPAAASAWGYSDLDHPLFKRIDAKAPSLSYAGVRKVVFRRRDGTESSFTQRVLRKGDLLRIEHPAGTPYEGQIIVENSGGRYHYLPAERIIRKSPRQSQGDLAEILGWIGESADRDDFQVKTFYGGRVAGVRTTFAKLERGKGKATLKMWVDERRGCILKREMFDGNDKLIGGYTFTDIKYDPKVERSVFALSIPGVPIVTVLDEMRKIAKEMDMKPFYLRDSSGFDLLWSHKIDSERLRALRQIYTDGKIRLSFFQVKGEIDARALKRQAGDRVNVYVWKRDGANLALLADMKEEELRDLARKVTL